MDSILTELVVSISMVLVESKTTLLRFNGSNNLALIVIVSLEVKLFIKSTLIENKPVLYVESKSAFIK